MKLEGSEASVELAPEVVALGALLATGRRAIECAACGKALLKLKFIGDLHQRKCGSGRGQAAIER